MSTMIFGGNGFIGRRLSASLLARGEEVVCADIAPAQPGREIEGVRFVPCDLTGFDSVISAMLEVRPNRTINLAYGMNSATPPHIALRLNVIGMDNFLEASRLGEVDHVVFSSSLAVNGRQIEFGDDHAVNEEDAFYGARGNPYAAQKVFNEFQARDYREKFGMKITSVRPANVTGHDKVFGSSDHVRVITGPARDEKVVLPFRDTMRNIVYVDDVADIFATITLGDPRHDAYNTGGSTVSLGELRDLVTEYIPAASVSFEHETGGKDECVNYVIDNARLRDEFGIVPRPVRACVETILEQERIEAERIPN